MEAMGNASLPYRWLSEMMISSQILGLEEAEIHRLAKFGETLRRQG